MEQSIKKAETKVFRLKDLNPAPYNPRKIKRENLDGLRASMGTYGCLQDIVINIRDGKNIVVSGHQRLQILLDENGPDDQWPCKVVDLGPEDEKALNLVMNNPFIQGEFIDQLPEHIQELQKQLNDDMAFVSLRLDQLKGELENSKGKSPSDGEIEFTREVLEENNYLVFVFCSKIDWQAAQELFRLKTVQSLDSKPGYMKAGIGRILDGAKLVQAMNGESIDDFYTQLQKG